MLRFPDCSKQQLISIFWLVNQSRQRVRNSRALYRDTVLFYYHFRATVNNQLFSAFLRVNHSILP